MKECLNSLMISFSLGGGNTFRISGAKYLVVQDKVDNGLSLALQTPAWGSLLCSVLLI
jgi:hypothetical protein